MQPMTKVLKLSHSISLFRYHRLMSAAVKPFVKWLGGKRRVLPELRKFYPSDYKTYYEPFLGGGSVLLDVAPDDAVVSDMNAELINAYKIVKTKPDELLHTLREHEQSHSRDHYLAVRAWDRVDSFASREDVDRAARFIYLNKTGFNGLHRVNRSNQNNVPFGSYTNPLIVDTVNIPALSNWLNTHHVEFSSESFSAALLKVSGSDNFLYLDPPYIPATATANFVSYAHEGFGMDKQEQLRDALLELNNANNFILSSNSDTPLTRELYSDFTLIPINVLRSVGKSAASRVKVNELIIVGSYLKSHLGL